MRKVEVKQRSHIMETDLKRKDNIQRQKKYLKSLYESDNVID